MEDSLKEFELAMRGGKSRRWAGVRLDERGERKAYDK